MECYNYRFSLFDYRFLRSLRSVWRDNETRWETANISCKDRINATSIFNTQAEIRQSLELSQNGLIRFLGFEDELTQAEILAFERGVRIPSLIILLRYARSVSINVEIIIDDKLELPKKF